MSLILIFFFQFEGTPFYPTNDRYWSVVDKYKVTQFYTAPTAIRSLMKFGDDLVKKNNLSSLRVRIKLVPNLDFKFKASLSYYIFF